MTTTPSPVPRTAGRVETRRSAGHAISAGPRLGPSQFGHRSLIEELTGLAELRADRTTKMPRPGAGTRAGTDPAVVITPLAYTSPRVVISPRAFLDPRGTTAIRAIGDF